jgi:hypothetical protein
MSVPLFLSYMKKLCYVAADYEAELRKDTQASCEVDGERLFTLSTERFKTAEILFQPHMGGMYVIFRYCLILLSLQFSCRCSMLTLPMQACYGLA